MKKHGFCLLSLLLALACLSGCAGQAGGGGLSHPAASGGVSEALSSLSEPSSSEPEPAPTPEAELPAVWEWEFDAPENHGMDAALLASLHTALEGTAIHSVVVVRDGVIVDEYYQQGYDADSVFPLNSCSKSFISALVGIALEEGLIDSLDTSIDRYFPQLAGTEKADITIRHLLEHKSGLEWHEWTRNGESFYELNRAENWVDYVLAKPLVAQPGEQFTYTTGGTHLLAAILEQAVGEPLLDYATARLFAPLGMTSVRWRADPQGILDGGNGIEMTARDAAKFGQLYLGGGSWEGRQLVPQDWVALSTQAQEIRDGTGGSYGYQWWVRPFGAAHVDTFYAMGAMGQFIFVVPQLQLVTVITADTTQFAPFPYFTDYILASVR